jgi:hypothetical protein
LFVVLAVAVCLRNYSMLVSFHTVAGSASIFRPYFLVPFLWAVGLVLLEIGLVAQSRTPQTLALAMPFVLLALAAFNGSNSFVHRQFMNEFEQMLGGSPLFLTLIAVTAFYGLAALRRVPAAYDLLTISVAGLAVVGSETHDFGQLTQPVPLPLFIAAAAQLGRALARRNSWRWILAGGGALAAATFEFRDTWFVAYHGFVPLHLSLLVVMAAGAWSRDAWSRTWQNLGALAMCLLAIIWSHLASHPTLTVELPLAALLCYPLVLLVVAWGYGRLKDNMLYDAAAAIHTTAFIAVACAYLATWFRQWLPGFEYIAWGTACFALATLISLLKTGVPQRWWAKRLAARRSQI